jgi:polyhydroxybutyrate depolymerase
MGKRIYSINLHLAFLIVEIGALAACQRPNVSQVTEVPASGQNLELRDFTTSLGPVGDQRDVFLHFPPQYDGASQLPLIIVLHGGGGSAAQVQRHTQMDEDADDYGFVVAYPNGSGRLEDNILTWNAGHCCGYALNHNIDDIAFLESVIDSLLSEYAIDPNRVYLTGISNGGMMSYRAAAELPEKIAGIAPIAGTIGGQVEGTGPIILPSAPSQPVSVIAFHGMQDNNVLYDGGIGEDQIDAGRSDVPVETSIDFWLDADGCEVQPSTQTQANGNIIIETYSGCDAGTNVVLVTIVDGGHAWPGAPRKGLVSDAPNQDIYANEMMLEFFLMRPMLR